MALNLKKSVVLRDTQKKKKKKGHVKTEIGMRQPQDCKQAQDC